MKGLLKLFCLKQILQIDLRFTKSKEYKFYFIHRITNEKILHFFTLMSHFYFKIPSIRKINKNYFYNKKYLQLKLIIIKKN